jgi:hypothetical protein
MNMKPHLIVDIRDRSMFSLLVDGAGNVQPCTHNVMEYSLRYFFGEIFLDFKANDQLVGKNIKKLLGAFESGDYDIIRLGRQMGWRWPYQWDDANEGVPIKHPLKVLSSHLPLENKKLMKWILRSSYAMLEYLLEPVFRCVNAAGLELSEINTVFIIPNYFHRRAKLLLHNVLRRMKVRKVMLVAREVATMMNCLEVPAVDEALVLDMGVMDTQLYRFGTGMSADDIHFEYLDCGTLRDCGWHSAVEQFCEGLYKDKLLDKKIALHRSAVNKALLALVFGMNPPPIAAAVSLQITHGLFDRLFVKSKRKLAQKYITGLKNSIIQMGCKDDIIIPLGLPFMVGHLEDRIFTALKSHPLPQSLSHRALERSAYGVAAGLNWLRQEPDRKIKIGNKAGFRVSTQPGQSIQLVPGASIPGKPGEQHTVRQILDFKLDEKITRDVLHLHLLWGMDPDPRYNLNVCLLPLNVTQDDYKKKKKIECAIHMQRARFGNNLMGTVTIRFGTQQQTAAFNIETSIKAIAWEDVT